MIPTDNIGTREENAWKQLILRERGRKTVFKLLFFMILR